MRLAWFSPLPPTRSGIAAYSHELLPILGRSHEIEVFISSDDTPQALQAAYDQIPQVRAVHQSRDFLPFHQRHPFDLIVYQLGNARCHDCVWAYVTRFPGLVVLHETVLHHARAAQLLRDGRVNEYRAELQYDQPELPAGASELAVSGTPSELYYEWPLVRPVIETARLLVVHNSRVADDLQHRYPGCRVDVVRMGVSDPHNGRSFARAERREVVFVTFGLITPEKQIPTVLRAFKRLGSDVPARLRLVGATVSHYDVAADIRSLGLDERVDMVGYVADTELRSELLNADVCLCLRWPTGSETSASWLRCLAAGKPTVISTLTHLTDVPVLDPRTWRPTQTAGGDAIGFMVDLLTQEESLRLAMRHLATDSTLRATLGHRARAFWEQHHTLAAMADDYERAIETAAAERQATVFDLPDHFRDDATEHARALLEPFGVGVDILGEADKVVAIKAVERR